MFSLPFCSRPLVFLVVNWLMVDFPSHLLKEEKFYSSFASHCRGDRPNSWKKLCSINRTTQFSFIGTYNICWSEKAHGHSGCTVPCFGSGSFAQLHREYTHFTEAEKLPRADHVRQEVRHWDSLKVPNLISRETKSTTPCADYWSYITEKTDKKLNCKHVAY